jgi:hypothetical protein
MLFAGGGVAAADDVVGQTYGDAKQVIANRGGTVDVSTTVGDRQNLNDCIVANARKATNRDGQGRAGDAKVLVDLNCAGTYDGSHPGYSLGSPQGRRMHDAQEAKAQQAAAQQQAQEQAALQAQQQADADAVQQADQ